MENNRVFPINKNKEPEIDSIEFICKQLESFPTLERAILELTSKSDISLILFISVDIV